MSAEQHRYLRAMAARDAEDWRIEYRRMAAAYEEAVVEREQARRIAVALEQENAHLAQLLAALGVMVNIVRDTP